MTSGHAGKSRGSDQNESTVIPGRQSLSPFIFASAAWLMLTVAAGPMLAALAELAVVLATGLGTASAAIDVLLVTAAGGVLAATPEMEVIAL